MKTTDVEILEYEPIIRAELTKFKVSKSHREDLTQECYLALWKAWGRIKELRAKGEDKAYSAVLCRRQIIQVWRKENQVDHHNENGIPDIQFKSLSDPRVWHKAIKLETLSNPLPTDAQLYEAILDLEEDEFMVIHLFLEGYTQKRTAEVLNKTRWEIRRLRDEAVANLKKHFEVKE